MAVLTTTGVAYAQSGSSGSVVWTGHVATTPNADCEWMSQVLQAGQGYSSLPGWPRMDTTGTVDGPNNCGNTGFQAAPGNLAVKQNLEWWDQAFSVTGVCNQGPWVYNSGWSHGVSTGYGWLSGYQPPCVNTWYRQTSSTYYWNGSTWRGAAHTAGWLYVWSTF